MTRGDAERTGVPAWGRELIANNLEPDDFDLVFAFPWPGEEE